MVYSFARMIRNSTSWRTERKSEIRTLAQRKRSCRTTTGAPSLFFLLKNILQWNDQRCFDLGFFQIFNESELFPDGNQVCLTEWRTIVFFTQIFRQKSLKSVIFRCFPKSDENSSKDYFPSKLKVYYICNTYRNPKQGTLSTFSSIFPVGRCPTFV